MSNDQRVNKTGLPAKQVEGIIEESLPAASFKVRLRDGRVVLARLAGKMRFHHIRVVPGDRVLVEITPYDDYRGRIVRRF